MNIQLAYFLPFIFLFIYIYMLRGEINRIETRFIKEVKSLKDSIDLKERELCKEKMSYIYDKQARIDGRVTQIDVNNRLQMDYIESMDDYLIKMVNEHKDRVNNLTEIIENINDMLIERKKK